MTNPEESTLDGYIIKTSLSSLDEAKDDVHNTNLNANFCLQAER